MQANLVEQVDQFERDKERWPGEFVGVRGPDADEICLSRGEIEHAQRKRLLPRYGDDEIPIFQIVRPAGSWEHMNLSRPAAANDVFSGLI